MTVIARSDLPSTWQGRVAHIRVDRKDAAAFSGACAGLKFDAVVDNIAYTPADGGWSTLYFRYCGLPAPLFSSGLKPESSRPFKVDRS